MKDEKRVGSVPGLVIPIGPIIVVVIGLLILRSRRKTKDDRAFSRIVHTIDESDLPERAKDILRQSVDEVRSAMSAIREMAGEIRAS